MRDRTDVLWKSAQARTHEVVVAAGRERFFMWPRRLADGRSGIEAGNKIKWISYPLARLTSLLLRSEICARA